MPKHGNASPSIGLFAEFAGAVTPCLPRDLNPVAMQRWIEPAGRPDLRECLRRAFKEAPTFVVRTVKILTVTCLGNTTASQLIPQGESTRVNDLITNELFPIQPHAPATYELELFQFVNHDPSWEDVLVARARRNLDEPTSEMGFCLGIQHRDEQREHPIVITHQPVRDPFGNLDVLVLHGSAGYRKLDLLCTASRWHRRDLVFVGVRKVAA
ncbi:MAG: hypothetical protein PHI63_03830 [Patescibacteria group bacterium]|nr:hypothetical protein [Patescibacteria group bacterium]